jgi:hypothetical protein
MTTYFVLPLHPAASRENAGTDPEEPWSTLQEVFEDGHRFGGGDKILVGPGAHGDVQVGPESRADDSPLFITIKAVLMNGTVVLESIQFWCTFGWVLEGVHVTGGGREDGSAAPAPALVPAPSLVPVPWTVYVEPRRGIVVGPGSTDITVTRCTVRDHPKLGVYLSGSRHVITECEVARARGIHCLDPGSVGTQIVGCIVHHFCSPEGLLLRGSHMRVVGNLVHDSLDTAHITSLCVAPDPASHVLLYRNRFLCTLDRPESPAHVPGPLSVHGVCISSPSHWTISTNAIQVDHSLALALTDARSCTVVHNTVVRRGPKTWFTTQRPTLSSSISELGSTTTEGGNIVANNLCEKLAVACPNSTLAGNLMLRPDHLLETFMAHPQCLELRPHLATSSAGAPVFTKPVDGAEALVDLRGMVMEAGVVGAYGCGNY